MALPVTGERNSNHVRILSVDLPRIGTFLGHKGACWQARLSSDGNLAATASADFTACVHLRGSVPFRHA